MYTHVETDFVLVLIPRLIRVLKTIPMRTPITYIGTCTVTFTYACICAYGVLLAVWSVPCGCSLAHPVAALCFASTAGALAAACLLEDGVRT